MFARYLRSLSRSQSLPRSRRPRAAPFLIAVFLVGTAKAEVKNVDQIIINGVLEGASMALKNKATTDYAKKAVSKKILENDGKAEIATKDGSIKINTENAESIKLAAEFRKNYKKSPECLEPTSEEISIKCANKYIQARKEALNPAKVTSH